MDYKPSKDFTRRLKDARDWRTQVEGTIKEVYAFCAPDRRDEFDKNAKTQLESDVFHELGEECAGDLAGDLITYFTPPEARWFNSIISIPGDVPKEQQEQIKALVEEREQIIGELFSSSNYSDMSPQWGFEAASHGTPAIWVDQGHMQQPIHFEVVPPSELLITPGHLGIMDRFREKIVHVSTLEALFQHQISEGQVALDEMSLAEKITRGTGTCKVIWGFWLDWSDPAMPQWRMEITIDGKCVTRGEKKEDKSVIIGDIAGSCPLLTGRFNPRPNKPWGRGPAIKSLPSMRILDKLSEMVLLGMEDAISSTVIYPDDGFLDLSEGIEKGTAIPAHRGFTRDQIYEFAKTHNLDVAFFSKEDLERIIRASFFQDGPRQRGDTPPTAAQWFDEARRVQQRIGKPSAPLWSELIYPMIQRVEYLGIQSGKLEMEIALDGQSVSIMPISPLQKAQNRDQIMIARSNIELAMSAAGPEGVGMTIDLRQTFQKVVDLSGDTVTVISTQEQPVAPEAQPTAPPPV